MVGSTVNQNLAKRNSDAQLSEYKKLLKSYKKPEDFDAFLATLNDSELETLYYDLEWQGRKNQQVPPGNWSTWIVKPGRGWGKTFLGGKLTNKKAHTVSRIALVGADTGEVRDVMIEGESGIIKTAHPSFRPRFNKHLNQLEWPNGAKALIYSAQEPESLRGPNNGFAWVDELFKFRYQVALWDELMMTMRSGDNPQVLVTSTPRPTKLCKTLIKDPNNVVTDGSMLENDALPKVFIDQVMKTYGGTRRGKQEIDGELLEDNPGALWKAAFIDNHRLEERDDKDKLIWTQMDRIIIAIDPATTSDEETSDATGIAVCGRKGDEGYVFKCKGIVETPTEWANRALREYDRWQGNLIVGEANNGGDMIETIIRNLQPLVAYEKVTATRGKAIRAEPVAALYEQGRVHHVGDPEEFTDLENEMLGFDPALGRNQKSPNCMDAAVWAFTKLFGDDFSEPRIVEL